MKGRTMINNDCIIKWPKQWTMKEIKQLEEVITCDHIDRCIADGRMNKGDPMKYLQSARFAQFNVHMHNAIGDMVVSGKYERETDDHHH